jgi:hypothetical protein
VRAHMAGRSRRGQPIVLDPADMAPNTRILFELSEQEEPILLSVIGQLMGAAGSPDVRDEDTFWSFWNSPVVFWMYM